MWSTVSLDGTHPKYQNYSGAEIKLNLTDVMGYIGFGCRCGLWFILKHLQLKKTSQEKV